MSRPKGTGNSTFTTITLPSYESTQYEHPRWIATFGAQRDIVIDLPSGFDGTALTFTSLVSEIDVAVGEEPQPGAPEKVNGETRELILLEQTETQVKFVLSSNLGTNLDNDGAETDPAFAEIALPKYLQDKFYFLNIQLDDDAVGDAQKDWAIQGQIALKYSSKNQ